MRCRGAVLPGCCARLVLLKVFAACVSWRTNSWCPALPYYQEILPLVKDHPRLPILAMMSEANTAQRKVLWDKLYSLTDPAQTALPRSRELIFLLDSPDKINKPSARQPGSTPQNCDDKLPATSPSLVAASAAVNEKRVLAHRLRKVDPRSGVAMAALVNVDWSNVKVEAEGWENAFPDQLNILLYLGARYTALKRFGDAERCLKKYIAISPDANGYTELAKCYKGQNDDDKWVQTWDEFSKLPSLGLEQAKARVTIADFYMSKKEFQKALPYAEEAAETYAGWALRAAYQANEGLGEWGRSELWARRLSERYPSEGRDWYRWCLRTGRGDLRAAAQLALTTPGRKSLLAENAWIQVHLANVNQEPKSALTLFETQKPLTELPEWNLLMAIYAHEASEPAKRDAALKRVPANSIQGRLAKWFQDRLSNPKTPFDPKEMEKRIDADAGQGAFGTYYLLGRILEFTGQKESSSPDYHSAACATRGPTHRFARWRFKRSAPRGKIRIGPPNRRTSKLILWRRVTRICETP